MLSYTMVLRFPGVMRHLCKVTWTKKQSGNVHVRQMVSAKWDAMDVVPVNEHYNTCCQDTCCVGRAGTSDWVWRIRAKRLIGDKDKDAVKEYEYMNHEKYSIIMDVNTTQKCHNSVLTATQHEKLPDIIHCYHVCKISALMNRDVTRLSARPAQAIGV